LIKPNHEELEEVVGERLDTLGAVVDAARRLNDSGISTVAVSLGGDGAVVVTSETVVHASATIDNPISTVGAGDCMLAGLLHGLSLGKSPGEALAIGVAWGAAAVTLPGSRVPSPADVAGIPVTVSDSVDRNWVLQR
ncbi:MAG: 1-phosphofructokinase, partial [Tetrasphaera sp.]|nr:1-phosphofructokinase [Tetrasphaera sp.]